MVGLLLVLTIWKVVNLTELLVFPNCEPGLWPLFATAFKRALDSCAPPRLTVCKFFAWFSSW